MSDGTPSPDFFEWFVGVMLTIFGGFGAVTANIYSRINSMARDAGKTEISIRAAIAAGDAALDSKIEADRANSADYREKMIERVSSLPTKDDLKAMETRIMSAIRPGRFDAS